MPLSSNHNEGSEENLFNVTAKEKRWILVVKQQTLDMEKTTPTLTTN